MRLPEELDREIVSTALDRLGVSLPTYRQLSAGDFERLMDGLEERHGQWKVRREARTDQLKAAGRVASSVPQGMGLREAARRGLISDEDAEAAIATLVQVLTEDEQDRPPLCSEVLALYVSAYGEGAGT